MSRSVKRVKGTLLLRDDRGSIKIAAKIIQSGGLVAFPTETVYGLGASAMNEKALRKIFTAKGRPPDNPLIVHLSSTKQLDSVARNIPREAYILASAFWPGPLSMVLPGADNLSPLVSAGLKTVAVRMPDQKAALSLIETSGVPIAAPSANLSGSPSPTTYRHVLDDLAGSIDAVIMSNSCTIGLESTVLDLSGPSPIILRPGGLPREDLEAVLGQKVLVSGSLYKPDSPSSPGMKYRHYTPRAPLILITGPRERRYRAVKTVFKHLTSKGYLVGLLNTQVHRRIACEADAEYLAANLYRALRQFDAEGVDLILAEETVSTGLGLAIMNRLRKAAVRIIKV